MDERLLAPASTHRNIGNLNSTYRPIAEARVLDLRSSAAQLECFGSKKPIAYPSPELVFGSAYCCQLSGLGCPHQPKEELLTPMKTFGPKELDPLCCMTPPEPGCEFGISAGSPVVSVCIGMAPRSMGKKLFVVSMPAFGPWM
jgi:hypothetical protein